jgi:energy-coupling factor transporter ATP-binding protein EcfA2
MGGRLSSRHFRNQLLILKQLNKLQAFFDFANEWTSDLRLTDLRVSSDGTGIDVFYVEGQRRLERELAWAGDGMQVWWQILHHVFRNADLPTIVLDEPEVFLHPDLQRRLARLLESTEKQVIVATHSSELLAEVDSKNIALVDRGTRSARKIKTNSGLLGIADQIGSRFNLGLARALRSRVVLFLEGQDAQLLRIAARIADLPAIDKESGVAIVEMDGFSPHVHVEAFEWLCADYLASAVKPYVVLDRDYKSEVQLDRVKARFGKLQIPVHIWARKEVESYLLQPPLIARKSGITVTDVEKLLDEVTEDLKAEVLSQVASHAMEAEAGPKMDKATILLRTTAGFESSWGDRNFRLARSPAKLVLAGLNRRLQSSGRKAVTFPALAKVQHVDEVDPEILKVLREISALATGL